MSGLLVASGLAAMGIGATAGCFGAWLTLRGRDRLRNRSATVGVFSAGILVGLALLSMLPDAMDVLRVEYQWRTAHVMLVFIASAAGMFVLENVVFTHEHVSPVAAVTPLASHDATSLDTASENQAAAASSELQNELNDAAIQAAAMEAASTSEIELACEPCDPEEDEPPPEPPLPIRTTARTRHQLPSRLHSNACTTTNGISAPWWSPPPEGCECCEEVEPEPSLTRAPSDAVADGALSPADGVLVQLRLGVAIGLRHAAWIIHAAVDGMVVGSIPSFGLLAPAAFAVLICALQDALAYSVFLTRRRASRTIAIVVLILFALAFPAGATLAAALQSGLLHSNGRQALAIVRIVMAAVFCYMATELAPAHTHSKMTNMIHGAAFVVGVAAAGMAELLEAFATDG